MKKKYSSLLFILFLTVFSMSKVVAAIKLPALFCDNMVLQRDTGLKIWGTDNPGSKIELTFNGQNVSAVADVDGHWLVQLQPMHFGGPYSMTIKDNTSTVHLKNILIGDVWLCSGQSNMEMPVEGWSGNPIKNSAEEIKNGNHPLIRLFSVDDATAYYPVDTLKGGTWTLCSPKTVASFSAVAYFYGRKLQQDLRVPVGLINSSWGGTIIETWISWDKLKTLADYSKMDPDSFPEIAAQWAKNKTKYNHALAYDPGLRQQWYAPDFSVTTWKKMHLPCSFGQSPLGATDGIVWFRKTIKLSSSQLAGNAHLKLGVIDDYDVTYVNGHKVGSIKNWYTRRNYLLEKGLLHAGENVIAVKVQNVSGVGGFTGQPEAMFLTLGKDSVSLSGQWSYCPSVTKHLFGVKDPGPNAFPSQLYNAMIAPMTNYRIKGVIWYQGESNTDEAVKYRTLFPMLINDWREKWDYQFPFIWVQLANFMAAPQQPGESNWAMLREAQHETLQLPNTGEAVAIDLGEARTVHPANKQAVGARLERVALKVAYKKHLEAFGPELKQMKLKKGEILLTFGHAKGGLVARHSKDGLSVHGFAIAGADHHFVRAKATIHGNQVIVSSDQVAKPLAVRYGWADNPQVNLYNTSGLPASPFRTDKW